MDNIEGKGDVELAKSRPKSAVRQLGLVVHPTRLVDVALREIDAWASAHGVSVGELPVPWHTRPAPEPLEAADCDLVLAVGGDGTALAALHEGAESSRPVLGVACGSLGVLTSVRAEQVALALDRFADGDWSRVAVPGLELTSGAGDTEVAINDIAIIRDGPGQIMVSIAVDEVLYARVAGDGVVAATALGSSAYNMAVGGPILASRVEGMAVTPVAPHGGSSPPLVVGHASRLRLAVEASHVGVRYELDGHPIAVAGDVLEIGQRRDYATLVELADEEPRLTALRRHGLVLDSPRLIARESRSKREA